MGNTIDNIDKKIERVFHSVNRIYSPNKTHLLEDASIGIFARICKKLLIEFKIDLDVGLQLPYIIFFLVQTSLPVGFGSSRKGGKNNIARSFYELKTKLIEYKTSRDPKLALRTCLRFLELHKRKEAEEWKSIYPIVLFEKISAFVDLLKSSTFYSRSLAEEGEKISTLLMKIEDTQEALVDEVNSAIITLTYFNYSEETSKKHAHTRVSEEFLKKLISEIKTNLEAQRENLNNLRVSYVLNFEKKYKNAETYYFKDLPKTAKISDSTKIKRALGLKQRRYSNK